MKIQTVTYESKPARTMATGELAVVTHTSDLENAVLVGTILVRHYLGFVGFKAGESIPRSWEKENDYINNNVFVRPLQKDEYVTLQ